MASAKSAIVIGGGIVGLNCALALQERGLAVTIFEADLDGQPASWGNAGHIAIEQVAPLASYSMIRSLPSRLFMWGGAAAFPPRQVGAWLPFGLRMTRTLGQFESGKRGLTALLAEALPAWRRRMALIGTPLFLKEQGHIVAWESQKTARAGRKHWSSETGTSAMRELTGAEAANLEAQFATTPVDAIGFDGTAQVADPGYVLSAMKTAFDSAGGRIAVGRIGIDVEMLASVDVVVACAGISTGDLLKPLGHNVPIIAERGYHIQTCHANWPDEMPPVVFEDRSVVVTGFLSGLRASSFVEFAHPDAPPDPRKWQRLKTHVAELGLPFRGDVSQWMGARPTLPDYLPAIGKSNRVPNLFYAFGHQHLGLTLGPLTGELVAALATGDQTTLDLSPFDLARFERKIR